MCATGMESVEEELTAVLQSHRNPTESSLAGVVTPFSSAAGAFLERQPPFSSAERSSMLGSGVLQSFSDSAGSNSSNMPLQTLSSCLDQGGQTFAPSPPMLSKSNNSRRQGLWSTSGSQRNFPNGRSNAELDMDPRMQVTDYSTALVDHCSPMSDPFRVNGGVSGGLARYHSAPSSFLSSLAELHQDGTLSSFFSDADLPPLNLPSDSTMDTEQSASSMYDDKYLISTRKFDRVGLPQVGTGMGGLVSQKSLQSVYKPSMEVLLENPGSSLPRSSNGQIPSTSQLPSSLVMPSNVGLSQQRGSAQTGQNLTLGNLSGSMNFGCGLGGDGGASAGTLGALSSSRSSGLLRQSSSPAGLLAQLSIDVQHGTKNNDRQSLSSPQSPEDSLSGGTSEENVPTPGVMNSMDVGGWEDAASSYMNWGNDNFTARKRIRDNMDLGDIMPLETTARAPLERGPAPGSLMRHMSLPTPTTKSDISHDDLLQSVPCRIRAKRGCATHPRSIAERVRRTKISERMRKLQELVPNMDKQQTNTADMLDEAVEYVKQLQRQVQELTESKAKCSGCCNQDHKTSAT